MKDLFSTLSKGNCISHLHENKMVLSGTQVGPKRKAHHSTTLSHSYSNAQTCLIESIQMNMMMMTFELHKKCVPANSKCVVVGEREREREREMVHSENTKAFKGKISKDLLCPVLSL